MNVAQFKIQVNTDITNKTEANSITPANVGTNIKDAVDVSVLRSNHTGTQTWSTITDVPDFHEQGGNDYGAVFVVGSTDAYNTQIISNNLPAITCTTTQNILIGTETPSAYKVDIAGTLRFGTHLSTSVIKGDLDFDNMSNATYIKQNAEIRRSIKIPGTGGNAPWIFNNLADQGIQINNENTTSSVRIQPSNGIRFTKQGFETPVYSINNVTNSISDINIQIGSGEKLYDDEPGYNIRLVAGVGGANTNEKGGNIYLTTGSGGGTGDAGYVIHSNISEYADNAAAIAAGLPIGAEYRTGDLLKVVH